MKKIITLILLCSVILPEINAQDIADVNVKARFERSKSIYFAVGPSFVQGALGDYGIGTSFETGFMKRLNKVMSIGAGLSYMGFKYDAGKTFPNYYDTQDDQTIKLTLQGGNVSLLSAGFNFKLNLIPVSDNTKFSVYGIATPFVSYYTRGEVSGKGDFYNYDSISNDYTSYARTDTWSKDDGFPVLRKVSKLTGGIYLGFGVEFFPAKTISGFIQATYGYTLPISFVSTSSYLNDGDIYTYNKVKYYSDNTTKSASYFNSQFPMVNKGFTAVSLKVGMAFNF